MELDRLKQTAQTELKRHQDESHRLKDMARRLIQQAEWHERQTHQWIDYMAGLALGNVIEIPQQRPNLTLIEGGLID